MDNSNFRQFLGASSTPSSSKKSTASSANSGDAEKKKERREKRKEYYRQRYIREKEMADKEEEERDNGGTDAVSYRDRAEERRKGVTNPDFESLGVGAATGGTNAQPGMLTTLNITTASGAAKPLTEEETKYLGGDVRTTHLVKGLDFALLEKMRGDERRDDDEDLEAAYNKTDEKDDEIPLPSSIEEATNSTLCRKIFYKMRGEEKSKVMQERLRAMARERFSRGKTLYAFEVQGTFANTFDFPRTIMNATDSSDTATSLSLSTSSSTADRFQPHIEDDILYEVGKIVAYLHPNAPLPTYKRLKKKFKKLMQQERREKDTTVAPKSVPTETCNNNGEDVDIFDDVGTDYTYASGENIPRQVSQASKKAGDAIKTNGAAEAEREREREREKERERERDARHVNLFGPNMSLGGERDREKKENGREMLGDQLGRLSNRDEYAVDMGGEWYDDEGERERERDGEREGEMGLDELATKMDLSRSEQRNTRKRRWDFDTEEEWDRYNNSLEANPKAAYQFGVKVKDGRKSMNLRDQKRRKDQKFFQEMRSIDKIMKDKYNMDAGFTKKKNRRHRHREVVYK